MYVYKFLESCHDLSQANFIKVNISVKNEMMESFSEDLIEPVEMAALDENCEYFGLRRSILMENAGNAIFQTLKAKVGSLKDKVIVVVAGTGNNGGDGFSFARIASREAKISVILIGRPESIRTDEAKINWKLLERAAFSVKLYTVTDYSNFESVSSIIRDADIVIDSIFGTGIRGRIREPESTAIDIINSSKGFKVAVDIPSGLDPATGRIHDKAVKADMTVTFHKAKPGLLKRIDYVGELVVAPIGIAADYELLVGPGDVKVVLKPRMPYSKKGDFGRLLVVGGSTEYSGAPALAALSALRTGVDIVIVAAPKAVANIIRSFSPNIIVRPLGDEYITNSDLPHLEKLIEQSDGIVVGPGLGLETETKEAILKLIEGLDCPILVDADALKALSARPTLLKGKRAIVTPHAGEFSILTSKTMAEPTDLKERMRLVKEASEEMGTTVLLKAHEDIISDGKRLKLNLTGNPGMTVGGTGDVLSGIAGAFLVWGVEPFRAACAAAFISGAAGDLVKSEKGYHLVATDVIEKIPSVMKEIEGT
ncbi:MAG: NAD(P)H-hydrate dehydratase [Thermoproteota archaeon]